MAKSRPVTEKQNMFRIVFICLLIIAFSVTTPARLHAAGINGPPQSRPTQKKETVSVPPPQSIFADFSNYRLGPEDVLKISVWKDESLSKEVLVRPDGIISFPLIGEILAKGKTIDELQKEVTQRIAPFIPEPSVTVEMVKVNYYKIYVIGRVNRSGEFLVGHPPDVLQALSLAGGVTPFASENGIKIFRRTKGNEEIFPFRFGDVKSGKYLEQNILLMPGDEVVVP
jgi:polysaccharide export outer membrane protein